MKASGLSFMEIWLPGPKIFVSYRRSDAGGHAGRLVARLENYYGRDLVFQDVEGIAAGEDFAVVLQSAVEQCDVVLVIVGPDWLTVTDTEGNRRLDATDDWVRREIMMAFKLERRVIPVLVGDAEFPLEEQLPDPLKPLARLQLRTVRPDRFEDDVNHLIKSIGGRGKKLFGVPLYAWGITAAIAASIMIIGLLFRGDRIGPMQGDFNVAVAHFTELGQEGESGPTDSTLSLADSVYERINAELTALNEKGYAFEVRSPRLTGAVAGLTREERAIAADKLAEDIRADVLIFGSLSETAFAPEFYIKNRAGHFRNAEELTGQYELGSKIFTTQVGAGNLTSNMQLRNELAGRTQALVEFVIGLSWYANRNFEEAQAAFKRALDIERWKDEDGKEVLHLFMANAAGKRGDLAVARREFRRVLELSPEYARGLLGEAEVLYLEAHGGCSEGTVDAQGLQRAESHYKESLTAEMKPAISNVDAKSALGLARVYACLSQGLVTNRWADAAAEFAKVVAEYEAGNTEIKELAMEAYAGLGLTLLPQEGATNSGLSYCRAKLKYETAKQLSDNPERTAVFSDIIDFIDKQLQKTAFNCTP